MSRSLQSQRASGRLRAAALLSLLLGGLILVSPRPVLAARAPLPSAVLGSGKPSPVVWTAQRELVWSTLDGKKAALSARRKPGTVLLFLWAIYCEPCLVELPYVDALYRKLRGEPDVAILSVNEDDAGTPKERAAIQAALAPYRLEVPVLLDARRQTEALVKKVLGTPMMPLPLVLILRDGKPVTARIGFDVTLSEEAFLAEYAAVIARARAGEEELAPPAAPSSGPRPARLELPLPWVNKERIEQQAPQVMKFLEMYFPRLTAEQRRAMFDETRRAVLRGEPAVFRPPAVPPPALPPPR